jgi:gliding motility-associated lipoprotein GldD
VVLFTANCGNDYTPKPRGFQRFEFPSKSYIKFSSECPFGFDIPVYANAEKDMYPGAENCWYNINYTPYFATLHLSYKPIKSKADYVKLTEESRSLVYKHTIKADEIFETYISNHYLTGMLYELSGNTATNFQFFVTDSSHHYLRGALYFNAKTNTDSVAPVLDFLKTDIIHMIESLRWKNQ